MPPAPLPLHTGDTDFVGMRRRGAFYVDKTAYFETLIPNADLIAAGNANVRNQILVRPPGFGKTLLLDTLEAWFQGLPPERTLESPPDLYGNTMDVPEGWSSPAWLWDGLAGGERHGVDGWHPVVRLDMRLAVARDLNRAVKDVLEHVALVWQNRGVPWDVPGLPRPNRDDAPDVMVRALTDGLYMYYGKAPVVLVDDCDITCAPYMWKDAHSLIMDMGPVFEMYTALVNDEDDTLYFMLACGRTTRGSECLWPPARVANISHMSTWAGICGFTQDEVDRHLAPHRRALRRQAPHLNDARLADAWQDRFGGYKFHSAPARWSVRVHNPFTLMEAVQRALSEPQALQDAGRGIWGSTWNRNVAPAYLIPIVRNLCGMESRRDEARIVFNDYMKDLGYFTWYADCSDSWSEHYDFPNSETALAWICDVMLMHLPLDDSVAVPVPDRLRACLEQGDARGFAAVLDDFVFRDNDLPAEKMQGPFSWGLLLQALLKCAGLSMPLSYLHDWRNPEYEVCVGDRIHVVEIVHNRPSSAAQRRIRTLRCQRCRDLRGDGVEVMALTLAFRQRHGRDAECRVECTLDLWNDVAVDPAGDGRGAETDPH